MKKMWTRSVAIFTARKRSLGQGNIFRSVCQEFCPQWGSTWADPPLTPRTRQVHPGTRQVPPGTRYPPDQAGTPPRTRREPSPRSGIPWDQAGTPPQQCMLAETGNKRAVRILLECILVGK